MKDTAKFASAAAPVYRRILYCSDFELGMEPAFAHALALARQQPEARLILLHVIPEPEAQFWKTYLYELDNVDHKAKRDIDERVVAYRDRVPAELQFDCEFRIGSPGEEILLCAGEMGADLIVMGRGHPRPLESLFFGNVPHQVLKRAPCPVLLVGSPDSNE